MSEFKGAFIAARVYEPRMNASKIARARCWQEFLHHGTSHSAGAEMLLDIINRCEREGIPYVLQASPGHGYYIKQAERLIKE